MSRVQKRKNRKNRLGLKKESYESMTKKDRIIVIAISLTFIFVGLYWALSDKSIPSNKLSKIYVTLKEAPKYEEHRVKSKTSRSFILRTKEYAREFRISGWMYEALAYEAFKSNIFTGDTVELKVKTSDLKHLNKNFNWNNSNDVYGLNKKGKDYIDLDLRKDLIDNDSKWAYVFVIFGLILFSYVFIKSKPLISIDRAFTIVFLSVLIILIWNSC